jgi:hypothetical protein
MLFPNNSRQAVVTMSTTTGSLNYTVRSVFCAAALSAPNGSFFDASGTVIQ